MDADMGIVWLNDLNHTSVQPYERATLLFLNVCKFRVCKFRVVNLDPQKAVLRANVPERLLRIL